jgi:dTMP kinase
VEARVRGLFITIEGGEGAGKSTQAMLLADRLREAGHQVLETREPGGTPAGDRIRGLLLDPAARVSPLAELLLYEASRAQLVIDVILPALERGEAVVCDRFFDSTTAYQAYGRGLDPETVRTLNLVATSGLVPDATVVLVHDLDAGLLRATRTGADRIEMESRDFHSRVAEGFRNVAATEPDRVVTVAGAGDPDDVARRVWDALASLPATGARLGKPRTA